MVKLFIEVVLPVLLIFAAGYGIQKWKKLDIRSVSTFALYVLIPSLVFETFYTAELNVQYFNMVLFTVILLILLILVNKLYARIKRYPQSVESGLILSTAFMNSGNYGAPIILFAYGQAGFEYAVSLLVLHAIIMNFFGVYYAARGQAGIKAAFMSVLEMPPTYAVLLAVVMKWRNIEMPENMLSAIELVGAAAVPTVMLVLGLQLAEMKLTHLEWGKITYGVWVRMAVSPLLAFAIIQFIPMDPLLAKVLIVSAAMPSAATTTMYALQ